MPPTASLHAPSGTIIPSFDSQTFAIYFWPCPKPRDFTRLTPAQRKWKDATDRNDPLLFSDSELADDWSNFAGDAYDYPQPGIREKLSKGNAREYAIASTFVARAKRAFLAGKSWEQFETEEEDIDSQVAALEKEPDRNKWQTTLDEALSNSLRLAVFDQLKQRLCNEIWLQPYRLRGPASIEARVKAEQNREALVNKIEQTVERWEPRVGWNGEEHPVPIFKPGR